MLGHVSNFFGLVDLCVVSCAGIYQAPESTELAILYIFEDKNGWNVKLRSHFRLDLRSRYAII